MKARPGALFAKYASLMYDESIEIPGPISAVPAASARTSAKCDVWLGPGDCSIVATARPSAAIASTARLAPCGGTRRAGRRGSEVGRSVSAAVSAR